MASKIQIGQNDVLIPVMGPTGAGKSFFINVVLNHPTPIMPVGTDLDSCTVELAFGCIENIQGYPSLKDRRIVLVDTPGFDNPEVDHDEISKKITDFLKESSEKGAEIAGVIYLHDITQIRYGASARRNLKSLQDICRHDALKNVVLVTTKWSRQTPDSVKHQQQLAAKHWKALSDKGAEVHEFHDDSKSAWKIIDPIIGAWEKTAFQPSPGTKTTPAKSSAHRLKGFFSSKRWWAF